MGAIDQFFQTNLDIVVFVYGMAFLIMGIAISLQPKKLSELSLARDLWLLAMFGLTHGLNELLDMWAITRGSSEVFNIIRWVILVSSYVFLFEFGRRLFEADFKNRSFWKLSRCAGPVLGAFILIAALLSSDFWKTGSNLSRYLLGFPGGLLTGLGLIRYKTKEKQLYPNHLSIKYFNWAGGAFLCYAFLGGIVVNPGNYFPANTLNTQAFLALTGAPVQVFRALCATAAAYGIVRILSIFTWEVGEKLHEAVENENAAKLDFHDIVSRNTDGIAVTDADGIVQFVNPTAVAITGRAKDDLLGRQLGWELREGASFEIGIPPLSGRARHGEVSVSGTQWAGKPAYLAVIRDITKRKRAEMDMRESYEIQGILNAMLQHSLTPLPLQQKLADHLATLFSIPWLAVESKGAVFLVTGRTLTLTVQQGLAPALLVSCAKIPFGKCLCGRAAESGQIVTSTCIGPDHEIVYEGMTPHGHYCAPIIAAGATLGVLNLYLKEGTSIIGKRQDFIKAVMDILAADILHARVEEQFAHSQKMEAIGHMAGGVAHDFNNILTAIMGFANFLSAALPAGDPKCDDVDQIIKAAERAAALTQQLLAFSRKQVVQLSVLNLDQIVPEVIKMVRRMIAEDIEFKTFLNSAPANVLANQGQLGQVLINLAVNARDAMPNGGKLTFETAQVELDENYATNHPGVSPGRYVMLAVSDTGQGMSPEVVQRIYEPFFTTKEQGKGTGLGLSTVYGIVRQSGGSIFVYSEPGKGTTFKIYLPRVAEKSDEKPAEKPSLSSCRGTETILLVEDDEFVRKFVYRVLLQNGYSVLEAATPREAIALCELQKDIHLMITDIVMPQMNGYELSKVMASIIPRMKVIFMSGYTDDAITHHNILEPGMGLLEKPLKVETILLKVREVLEARPQ